jgi:hypothetical protein
MPVNQFDRVLHDTARHRNMTGMSERDGYVHEVKGDKMRVVMGIRPDGSPWLSPWMPADTHRGGSLSRTRFEKGQNVRVSAPGGDYRQGTVAPGSHSQSFPKPAHADSVNGDSYQAGKLRMSAAKKGGDQGGDSGGGSGGGQQQGGGDEHYHEVWIAKEDTNNPKHQDQTGKPESGGGDSGSQQQQGGQQQQQDSEAAMKTRVSEENGITHRVGKGGDSFRFAVSKDGVKLCFGDNSKAVWIDKDGIWSTHPIQQKSCNLKNDDK